MLLINLLPWRRQRLRRRARRWLALLLLQLILVAVALAGFYWHWHQQRLMLQRELDGLSAQQRQLTQQYQQTRRMWHQLRDYQAQRDADEAALRHNQRYLTLLEQMASMMPRRLWLTDLADRGDHLLISGLSENYTDIVDLNRSLTRHPDLARVRVLQARRQNDRRLLRFSLQADWVLASSIKDGRDGD
ncbi:MULTISPECIES: PilN domain-containing protein [unclassified Brenneria]|uniref:PilN domain-containing protein n=1 Tax=unclassified Brenneria TaxID=2634434 RepID=UPI0029C24A6F|nr:MULTISPECIES: PilN domain-containing protein [unclassified Brenneria]MDX5630777.1 PilN domain-containing protein [Brenneria sp. L3-3Z]MDX5697859.1 PilN domain-containing protein [Brenneria sp. L4-2C]MEE3664735.1 PilN domain-containing protein [Brenneria sp. g21c3]